MGNCETHNQGRRYTDRGVKTRQKLVDALLEIVSTDGLQSASVRAITRRAGCNEAILYQHFKNKDTKVLLEESQQIHQQRLSELQAQRAVLSGQVYLLSQSTSNSPALKGQTQLQ